MKLISSLSWKQIQIEKKTKLNKSEDTNEQLGEADGDFYVEAQAFVAVLLNLVIKHRFNYILASVVLALSPELKSKFMQLLWAWIQLSKYSITFKEGGRR